MVSDDWLAPAGHIPTTSRPGGFLGETQVLLNKRFLQEDRKPDSRGQPPLHALQLRTPPPITQWSNPRDGSRHRNHPWTVWEMDSLGDGQSGTSPNLSSEPGTSYVGFPRYDTQAQAGSTPIVKSSHPRNELGGNEMRDTRTDSLVRATCLHFRTVSTLTAGLEQVVCQTCGLVAAGRTPKRRHWAVWGGTPIRIG